MRQGNNLVWVGPGKSNAAEKQLQQQRNHCVCLNREQAKEKIFYRSQKQKSVEKYIKLPDKAITLNLQIQKSDQTLLAKNLLLQNIQQDNNNYKKNKENTESCLNQQIKLLSTPNVQETIKQIQKIKAQLNQQEDNQNYKNYMIKELAILQEQHQIVLKKQLNYNTKFLTTDRLKSLLDQNIQLIVQKQNKQLQNQLMHIKQKKKRSNYTIECKMIELQDNLIFSQFDDKGLNLHNRYIARIYEYLREQKQIKQHVLNNEKIQLKNKMQKLGQQKILQIKQIQQKYQQQKNNIAQIHKDTLGRIDKKHGIVLKNICDQFDNKYKQIQELQRRNISRSQQLINKNLQQRRHIEENISHLQHDYQHIFKRYLGDRDLSEQIRQKSDQIRSQIQKLKKIKKQINNKIQQQQMRIKRVRQQMYTQKIKLQQNQMKEKIKIRNDFRNQKDTQQNRYQTSLNLLKQRKKQQIPNNYYIYSLNDQIQKQYKKQQEKIHKKIKIIRKLFDDWKDKFIGLWSINNSQKAEQQIQFMLMQDQTFYNKYLRSSKVNFQDQIQIYSKQIQIIKEDQQNLKRSQKQKVFKKQEQQNQRIVQAINQYQKRINFIDSQIENSNKLSQYYQEQKLKIKQNIQLISTCLTSQQQKNQLIKDMDTMRERLDNLNNSIEKNNNQLIKSINQQRKSKMILMNNHKNLQKLQQIRQSKKKELIEELKIWIQQFGKQKLQKKITNDLN